MAVISARSPVVLAPAFAGTGSCGEHAACPWGTQSNNVALKALLVLLDSRFHGNDGEPGFLYFVVPVAFRIAAKSPVNAEQQVRHACRDMFRETRLLERIIPGIEEMLAAGEIPRPEAFEEQVPPAIPNQESIGDAGHRS